MKVGELVAAIIAIAGTAFVGAHALPGLVRLHVKDHDDVGLLALRIAAQFGGRLVAGQEPKRHTGQSYQWHDCMLVVGDIEVMIMSRHEHVPEVTHA